MYKDLKVTSGEVAANNVKSAPDRLQGTATENKNIFDKLVELFVGKYNELLEELDDNEMTAISPITVNGYTISHDNSGVTQGMYGTNQTQYPTQGGTFIIPYIITDERGHIVSAGNSEVQLPSGGTMDYDDLSDKPSINSVILSGNKTSSDLSLASATHTHTTSEVTDFPTLATVATTGDYDDLSDKPSIPTKVSDLTNDSGYITGYTETDPVFSASAAAGIQSSDITAWNGKSDFSGDYNDLTNKPTIPVKNIWYATCSTGAATTAKTATSSTADFTLSTGNMVRVLFTNTNTATSPTISIDGSTAKNIRIRSGSTGAMTYMWRDNEVVDLVYDGTNFVMSDGAIATTTYYGITTLSSSTSSTSETVSATPKAVKTAYDLANGKADAVHTHTKSDITDFPSLATVATTGDYDDLTDKPTIPTKVSDLNNDSGFISSETDPVFTASDAYGISSSDITAWNGKSTVSLNRKTTSGTNIADLTIDGTTTQLYAPTSGGATSYDDLSNRPQINSTTLTGNKTLTDLGMKTEILNLFYPVGSYYETSDTSFDPEIAWGGQWQLETEGQVHVSGSANGTYQVTGAPTDTTDGGSADAIVPYHRHSVSAVTGGITGGSHDHGSGTFATNSKGSHSHEPSNTSYQFMACEGTSSAALGRYKIKQGTGSQTDHYYVSSATAVARYNTTESTGAHTHDVTGTSGTRTHTHNLPAHNTNYAGTSGNTTGANMQPYIVVNRWHRTA